MTEIKGLITVSKVYGKHRVQIPSEIWRELEINDGNRIAWFKGLDGNFYIKKVESWAGIRYQRT